MSDDCISRHKAIVAITACDGKSAQIEAIEKLPSVTPQPKTGEWIPVSERLPEEKVEVLATTEWGSITIAERYSANDYFIYEGATNADEDDIIAWMPLPKPYKAQESEG